MGQNLKANTRKPPMLPPIHPMRGVVGDYIDSCIMGSPNIHMLATVEHLRFLSKLAASKKGPNYMQVLRTESVMMNEIKLPAHSPNSWKAFLLRFHWPKFTLSSCCIQLFQENGRGEEYVKWKKIPRVTHGKDLRHQTHE